VDAARKLASYDDLLALPSGVRAEILGGEIVVSPGALPEHGRIQAGIGRQIGGPFDEDDGHGGPGGWWILPEVDVRLESHEVVRPDVTGWRRARLPSPWGVRPIDVVPDWICEIESPSNVAVDRVRKASLYAKSGVAHYWLVDPVGRTVESLVLRDGAWLRDGAYTDGDVAPIRPFEAIAPDVGRLFPPR